MPEDSENIDTKINIGSESFKKYFTNTSWLFFEKIIRLVVTFIVGILIIRYLAPNEFGLLSYAMSFVGIFAAVSSLGIDSILTRELVKSPDQRDLLLGTAFTFKLLGAAISIILLLTVLPFMANNALTNIMILIIASATFFQSFNVIDFYFQSRVTAKYSVYAQSSAFLLGSIIKILLIVFNAPLIYFAIVILIEAILLASGFIIVYKKRGLSLFEWKSNKIIGFNILRDSWPLILSGIIITIYIKIGQVLIKELMNETEVGYYGAAARLCEAWYFVPMAITASLFPAIINAKQISEKLYLSRLQKLYDLMAWMAILIALPVTFFSKEITFILLGAKYLPSAPVLTIYIWAGVATFLGVASSQYLITENLTKLSFYRTLIGLIVNVILNLILIPEIGIIGSAVATLVSYSMATISIGFTKRTYHQLVMMMQSILFINMFKFIVLKWQHR
ncbi:MAG: O-unit flippase [Ignavibacteria bacterium RIFOXYB2_FULL_35_12]|nr:MAG: O-unit flippase [Ignavibacteria bacterium GWA2_36_19]OGU54502.1 MAG: O-unit flippase [Ignavibacteria bacterium GWC2_35_8]OGU62646.1 MAG: O-unit flippase [Ignavibacteria bacterium GWF2_35_20]OGU88927.1 MAG: O-unit flippase [Ignavibacteria bacterium RIFOXYC12_FULL_35_11]OGU89549.1 MAG: O-unit flippase [Ignavibacteria bacterium RIFOXYA12_FULL_35_25]OGU94617.1 MAG: O-unit flippase [Ignavibacteria bacterium RIFOXYB12_FULL_35_14]OGV01605.1 MAG: O-unit flippase [Ignavibacteria bacterium RIFO